MYASRTALLGAICSGVGLLLISGVAWGQEEVPKPSASGPPLPEARLPQFPTTYSTLDAGRDAHERGEKRRREDIDSQLQTQADILWYYGQPGDGSYVPGLEAAYAGPRWRAPPVLGPLRASRYYPTYPIFEPWPLVPGDIYGYPYFDRVPQPLGHKVVRTGPNSYIYRPVYESDLGPREPAPEPARPEVERVPAPAPEPGPREF